MICYQDSVVVSESITDPLSVQRCLFFTGCERRKAVLFVTRRIYNPVWYWPHEIPHHSDPAY
jgi:hypothetical protein